MAKHAWLGPNIEFREVPNLRKRSDIVRLKKENSWGGVVLNGKDDVRKALYAFGMGLNVASPDRTGELVSNSPRVVQEIVAKTTNVPGRYQDIIEELVDVIDKTKAGREDFIKLNYWEAGGTPFYDYAIQWKRTTDPTTGQKPIVLDFDWGGEGKTALVTDCKTSWNSSRVSICGC